jgi:uncharacterized phiE125 gp8 family phage protein
MRIDLITAATAWPVDVDTAKAVARVSSAAEDALVDGWIRSATSRVQALTDRQLITATFELVLDSFSDWSWLRKEEPDRIELRPAPLGTVTSVKYLDTNGVEQTLVVDTDYYVITPAAISATCLAGAVCLMPSMSWPSTQADRRDTVKIRFSAGYGSAATAVPEQLRDAVLAAVAEIYDGRPRPDIDAAIVPHIQDFILWRRW